MVWSILMEWKKPTGKKISTKDIPAAKQAQELINSLEQAMEKLKQMRKSTLLLRSIKKGGQ